MKVLVTGANGFVGSAMVASLLAAAKPVRAAVRSMTADRIAGCEQVAVGDLCGSTDWSGAVAGIDCIVHIAARAHVLDERSADPLAEFRAVNRDATMALAHAAQAAGVRRFVLVSTIGVNGNETRGTPLRIDDAPAPHSAYALSKWEAEQQLADLTVRGGMDHVIVRPPLILGPNPKGNLGTVLAAIRRGLPLPLGSVRNNRRDLVSLGVLCDLLSTVIDHPAASRQTFLVSDGFSRSTRTIVEELARIDGRAARFLSVPAPLIAAPLRLMGKSALVSQLFGDLEIDISQTRTTLGWDPRRTFNG